MCRDVFRRSERLPLSIRIATRFVSCARDSCSIRASHPSGSRLAERFRSVRPRLFGGARNVFGSRACPRKSTGAVVCRRREPATPTPEWFTPSSRIERKEPEPVRLHSGLRARGSTPILAPAPARLTRRPSWDRTCFQTGERARRPARACERGPCERARRFGVPFSADRRPLLSGS
jgi:hypothetical protein